MIPEKTIERLSVYRRLLEMQSVAGAEYVYSHQLAEMVSGTAAQVRRDLMTVGVARNSNEAFSLERCVAIWGGCPLSLSGRPVARYLIASDEKISGWFNTCTTSSYRVIAQIPLGGI